MKKLLVLLMVSAMTLSLAGCGSNETAKADEAAEAVNEEAEEEEAEEAAGEDSLSAEDEPEFVTVKTKNAEGDEVEVEIPYNAGRIAVMELGALDILDNLGVGDHIVGVSKGSSIDYLQSYVDNDDLLNLGTIKEADLEAVMESEPDVIFIGGRLSSIYDELSEIAPVILLSTDTEIGLVESTSNNAKSIASIFGLENQIDDLLADYADRIEALQEAAAGQNAVVGMVNAGGFGVLGNDGRCSIIGVEIGFENIGLEAASSSGRGGGDRSEGSERGDGENSERGGEEASEGATATHGNEASFEVLVSLDPDYIFIMDRDAAIATEGAQLAQEVMDNELVQMTSAYQNDQIVYLEHSNIWYTAEGGITALGIMLDDLESQLLK